ncbi:related to DNA2 - DNA helicase [Melanopsichium pennsylvanicum]|uniref:DNA replication ATP-dependent helicase/nuclease DNA2 n=2 Tax=Melanopsichium pennsylvanicum TaxID=63383 RepID=A0AAJ5C6Z8_9BASI|nr:related to DNA2-DNA helicase [Melanopsichium pennsylvanicum 4]SNX86387.1 related to DNA2 - DNA helicase [Melanopsichium pennsylvanicum]
MALDAADSRFMDDLFADLDASLFSIPPSQSPPKKKPARLPELSQRSKASTSPISRIAHARSPLKDTSRFQQQPLADRDLEDWFRPPPKSARKPTTPRIVSPSVLKRQKIQHGNDLALHASSSERSASPQMRTDSNIDKQAWEQCNYTRCRVLAIAESSYEVKLDGLSGSARSRSEKLLVLEADKYSKHINQSSPRKASTNSFTMDQQPEILLASLRDDWMQTMVSIGSIVHLVGRFEDGSRKIPILLDDTGKSDAKEARESKSTSKIEVAMDQPAVGQVSAANGDDDDEDLWDDLASMPSLSQCAAQELLASEEAPTAKIMIFASRSVTSKDSPEADHALNNLLVVHPDVLVPATKVADVASCIRKPVVQDRLKGASDVSVSLVMGNMLHELLQACLTASPTAQTSQSSLTNNVVKQELSSSAVSSSSPWPEQWQGIGDFSRAFVESQVQQQVHFNIESLYAIELSADDAAVQLREKAAPFAHFARTFLLREDDATFHPEATLRESGRPSASEPSKVRLRRILDVEEEIWSPIFGLKGKVDVSVECDILEQSDLPSLRRASSHPKQALSHGELKGIASVQQEKRRVTTSVVPLEIKTGRAEVVSTEHRAQTMLYTLMMSDRYGVRVSDGLLYYSKSGELHRISRSRNEVRSLVIGRNELAHYLRHDAGRLRKPDRSEIAEEAVQVLPPTIDNEHKCRRCYAVDGCMLFRRAVENVIEPSEGNVDDIECRGLRKSDNLLSKRSPIADVYEQKIGHLSDIHLEFFRKWDHLLNLEEEDAVRFRREMWTMTAEQREKVGRCFGSMRLDLVPGSLAPEASSSMRRAVHRFVRHHDPTQSAESGLLSGHITVNDPVTISIEPDMLSVAQGFVTKLTPTAIEVGLDHSLDAAMRRALEKSHRCAPQTPLDVATAAERLVFRIDKDELGSGMGRVRANLAALFLTLKRGGDVKRRELIVDMRPPRFLRSEELDEAYPAGGKLISRARAKASINEDQRTAIDKVLSAQDYALVLGMPGTGKTTTIANLIELLVKLGKRILLTSYTHSAVDTILRKLAEDEAGKDSGKEGEKQMRILRLGSKDKVHPDAQRFLLPRCKSLDELTNAFESPNVVAATCLSIHHTFFSSGVAKKLRSRSNAEEEASAAYLFDYCIVDEASQIPLPTCLGPLRFADKFVLVGDHHQLPPLVKNAEAKAGGLDVSLFKLLTDHYGEDAMVALRSQYRMNDDIMRLSNELVYRGELKAGSESVRDRALVLSDHNAALHVGGGEGWMEDLLQPASKVRLLDTSRRCLADVGETKHGELVKNEFEAELMVRIASALVAGGCKPEQIAVVTPYRQQIKLLRSLLVQDSHTQQAWQVQGLDEIELLTADQSQGRDKDVILITFTRANLSSECDAEKGGNTGELLNDLRRLNVTLTRAKRKLIMVGHRSTLEGSNVLRPLLRLVHREGWVREI